MTVTVRRATPADSSDVQAVFLRCWRVSYADVLPAPARDAMTDERAAALWTRVLASDDGEVALAVDDGRIVGVTRYDVPGGTGTVYSLYVDPGVQGRGIGTRLLDHALSWCAGYGVAEAHLWAFSANRAGLAFYAARGWTPDGTTRVEDEFGEPEVRLRTAVRPGPLHAACAAAVRDILTGEDAPAGVVVGVGVRGTPAWATGGVCGSQGTVVTPRTRFDLASVTKVFTMAALQRLVRTGAVGWDDEVARYVPLPGCAPGTTLRELAWHRAGLWEWQPLYLGAEEPVCPSGSGSPRSTAPEQSGGRTLRGVCPWTTLAGLPLRYPRGAGRHYSDLGFMLLGRVVAEVTGTPLDQALSAHVIGPLGLRSTAFGPVVGDVATGAWGDAIEARMVATGDPYPVMIPDGGFPWRDREVIGEASDGNAYHAFGGVSGHAGLFADVSDLLGLAGSLAAGDEFWGDLGPVLTDGPDAGQALGWRSLTGEYGRLLWHPGYTGCAVGFLPGTGAAIALLTNRLTAGPGPIPVPREVAAMWDTVLTHVLPGLPSGGFDTVRCAHLLNRLLVADEDGQSSDHSEVRHA